MTPPTWVEDLWVGAVVRRFEYGRERGVLWVVVGVDDGRSIDVHGHPYAWLDVKSFTSSRRNRLLSYEVVVMPEPYQHDYLRPGADQGTSRSGLKMKKKSKDRKKQARS